MRPALCLPPLPLLPSFSPLSFTDMALTHPVCCPGRRKKKKTISLTSCALFSPRPPEKEDLSRSLLFKRPPGDCRMEERRGQRETSQDRYRSSAYVMYGYRAKQPRIYGEHSSCIVHVLRKGGLLGREAVLSAVLPQCFL